MATPSQGISGLNLYNQDPASIQEYRDVLKEAEAALKARYENPNWFNVAAGFLKPQLGGFAASLGSAGAALGDWQEKQRANELTLAQMRAENARAGLVLNSKMGTARAQADVVKTLGGPGTPAGSAADLSARGSGDPNIVPSANAATQAVQGQAKAAYEAALQDFNLQKGMPGGVVSPATLDAMQRAIAAMVKAGLPEPALPAGSAPVGGAAAGVPGAAAEPAPVKRDYVPMTVKPISDPKASTAVMKNNIDQIDKQNKEWDLYHATLGSLVKTPAHQLATHSLGAITGLNPKYAMEVTDLVNKHGGWAALINKGASAAVSAGNPVGSNIGANLNIPLEQYYIAELKPHLKETYDIMFNNLGAINTAIQKGYIPGMSASVGGLNQSGRALWHSLSTAHILSDQAANEYDVAQKLKAHTNPASATQMPDVYQSEQMRRLRTAYNKKLNQLNQAYRTGTVERRP
jgi:hypothetical protein